MTKAKHYVQLKKGLGKPAVVMRREPVTDGHTKTSMCCLTMYSPERSPIDYSGELRAVAETLGKIDRKFLVRCTGVTAEDLRQHVALPGNIAILDGVDGDTVIVDGKPLKAGWGRSGEYMGRRQRDLAPMEASVIRLLGLLSRNADVADVTTIIKRDPAIKYNLLRYLNSAKLCLAAYGGFRSFEQATMLLGYRQLSRWLSMYLLHSIVEEQLPELYLMAVTRGRQMELLAELSGRSTAERDLIFITGAFSLVDRMLGVSMEAVLAELGLVEGPVAEALLHGDGEYMPFLRYALASENGTEDELYELLADLDISARDANQAMVDGIHYAAGTGKSN